VRLVALGQPAEEGKAAIAIETASKAEMDTAAYMALERWRFPVPQVYDMPVDWLQRSMERLGLSEGARGVGISQCAHQFAEIPYNVS